MTDETLKVVRSELEACRGMQAPLWDQNAKEHRYIVETLERIDNTLRGNGEPGLRSDVEGLKTWSESMKKLYWIATAAVVGLFANFVILLVTNILKDSS